MIFSPWGHQLTLFNDAIDVLTLIKNDGIVNFSAASYQWTMNIDQEYDMDYGLLTRKDYKLDEYEKLNWNSVRDLEAFTVGLVKPIDALEVNEPTLEEYTNLPTSEQDACSLMLAEYDILKKITNQKFKRPFYFLDSHDGNKTVPPTEYFSVMGNLITSLLSKSVLLPAKMFGDPLDTNSGMPFSESSPSAKIKSAELFSGCNWTASDKVSVHNAYGTEVPRDVAERLNSLSDRFSCPPLAIMGVIAGRRSGPSRKPGPVYNNNTGQLQIIGEISNMPRTRQVFMAAYTYNLTVTHTYRLLKSARLDFDPCRHPVSYSIFHEKLNAMSKSGQKFIVIEIDASGFDKTVPLELRQMIFKHPLVKNSVPNYEHIFAMIHADLPYISADPFGTYNSGMMIREFNNKAGLYSGIKLTSEIGGYCGLAILAMIGLKTGKCTLTDILDRSWMVKMPVMSLGDDMLLAFPYDKPYELTALTKALTDIQAEIGMSFKTSIGRRFLMKHVINNDVYPVYSRILQQSIWNEKRRAGLIYQLGCLGRYDGYHEYRTFVSELPQGVWSDRIKRLFLTIDSIFESVNTRMIHREMRELDRSELRKKITEISAKLALSDQMELISLYTKLQYSSSGRDLLTILESSPLLMKLLNESMYKEHNLTKLSMQLMGLEPLK